MHTELSPESQNYHRIGWSQDQQYRYAYCLVIVSTIGYLLHKQIFYFKVKYTDSILYPASSQLHVSRSNLMRLYSPSWFNWWIDQDWYLGGTWTWDLPIFSPDALTLCMHAPSRQANQMKKCGIMSRVKTLSGHDIEKTFHVFQVEWSQPWITFTQHNPCTGLIFVEKWTV